MKNPIALADGYKIAHPKVANYMRDLAVACPTCAAPNGTGCTARGRYMTGRVHVARSKAAEAQREADRLFKFVITEGTTQPINDPNPELTALRNFVNVTKPLRGMFEIYRSHGNHVEYSDAMLKALEAAEETLAAVDRLVEKFIGRVQ